MLIAVETELIKLDVVFLQKKRKINHSYLLMLPLFLSLMK